MSAEMAAVSLLNEHFLADYPREAARALEALPTDAGAALLRAHSPTARLRTWQALAPDRAADVLGQFGGEVAQHLLAEAEPRVSVAALLQLEAASRESLLGALPGEVRSELRALMQYAKGTAGHLMDPRVGAVDAGLAVADAIERLRGLRARGLRDLFAVDEQMRLVGQVEIEDLALTGRDRPLREITRGVTVVVRDTDSVARVLELVREHTLVALPVVDESGRFLGVIRQAQLLAVAQRGGGFWSRWLR
jgi:magnesium transporter